MKSYLTYLIFLLIFTLTNQSIWRMTLLTINQKQVKTLYHYKINLIYLVKILSIIDRSMVTSKTIPQLFVKGFIQTEDILCVSLKMVYWFSLSGKGKRVVRTGGGLLAGLWEITVKFNQEILINRLDKNGHVNNLLFPGSEDKKGFFGADVYGGYEGSSVIWGLEHSKQTQITAKFGKDIIEFDKQMYAADDGVFVEFQGLVGNASIDNYIESDIDTDPRPNVIGKTLYTLTYRIPARKNEFTQELVFKPIINYFGPINTAKVVFNLPGYGSANLVYAADKMLMNNGQLKNVSINKYFKNSCTKVYFYDSINNNAHNKMFTSNMLKLACIGNPKEKVPFVCMYPDLEFIPKVAWEDYKIELADNRSIQRYGRFHSMIFKLINSKKKSALLKNNQTMTLIMRIKVIASFTEYDKSKPKIKE